MWDTANPMLVQFIKKYSMLNTIRTVTNYFIIQILNYIIYN